MRFNTLILTGMLALGSVSLLSAKSYHIIIDSPAKAGVLELASGEYSLKLVGANAVFTDKNTGKKFTTPVTAKDTGEKFADTAVDTVRKDGTNRVKAIELGGSRTELDFGD